MIEFVVKDRDDPAYRKNLAVPPTRRVRRKGQEFMVGGERLELFTIKTMAEVMDRTTICLLRWERAGLFPKPLFSVTGHKKTKRWYSAIQLVNCHRVAWYKYRFSKGRFFDLKQFSADIREVFYANKLVVSTTGQVVRKKPEK